MWRMLHNWWKAPGQKVQRELDIDTELRFHIETYAADLVRSGMPAAEALRRARLEFGGTSQVKENIQSVLGNNLVETMLQDLRYGSRMLLRNRGFALVAVLTLALGIGANTAIFSIINGILLNPLPFPESGRVVRVEQLFTGNKKPATVSYPDFVDWSTRNHVFEQMAAFHDANFILTRNGESTQLTGAVVTSNLFSLLRVSPAIGRSFVPEDDKPGSSAGSNAMILSWSVWQSLFGADRAIIGRPVEFRGATFVIVGVMPPNFQYPIQSQPIQLWTTVAVDSAGRNPATADRDSHFLHVIARLKSDATLNQAQAEMGVITAALDKQYPDLEAFTAYVLPESEEITGNVRSGLLILLAAVGCVLLIACVNVANMQLAKALSRHGEIAVRSALGAGRSRIVRQLLTESVLLSLLSAIMGTVLAAVLLALLTKMNLQQIPRLAEVHLDGSVLEFTSLVAIITGILFGLVPAMQISKGQLTESLKESGRSSFESFSRRRMRSALLVVEVTAALALLVCASLLVQSLFRLQNVSPGFEAGHVLTVRVSAPNQYNPVQRSDFFDQLIARCQGLPGVRSVSAVWGLPFSETRLGNGVEIEGKPLPVKERPVARYNLIEPGYFSTMGIPIIKGRDFTNNDHDKSPNVAIVNQTLAQQFFPGENPLGKRINPGSLTTPDNPPFLEIVGVVGDVKQNDLSSGVSPEIYAPFAQVRAFSTMYAVVRTEGAPESASSDVRHEINALSQNAVIYQVRPLDEYLRTSVTPLRFNSWLLGIFAGLSLVLAAVGLYGVITYSVAQRSKEIGIRMALGAMRGNVLWMILRETLIVVAVGIGFGIPLSIWTSLLISTQLYAIKPGDPLTMVVAIVVMLLVAIIAAYMPARHAAKLDPLVALRHE